MKKILRTQVTVVTVASKPKYGYVGVIQQKNGKKENELGKIVTILLNNIVTNRSTTKYFYLWIALVSALNIPLFYYYQNR